MRRRIAAESQVHVEDLLDVLPDVDAWLEGDYEAGRFSPLIADGIVRSLCQEAVDRPRNCSHDTRVNATIEKGSACLRHAWRP